MENEKGPSPQEDLGDSKQEELDNDLEEAANQYADSLMSKKLEWHDSSYDELESDIRGSSKTVEKLGDNIRILESMPIDCEVPEWHHSYDKTTPVREVLGGSPDYDQRKVYLIEQLAELEKLREKLVRELIHRRDSFQDRVNYASRELARREESRNAEWKPAPVEDSGETPPTEPVEEPTKE